MLEYAVIKTSVAMEVGTNAAILLQNIHYWIEKNKANEINFHDGRYWTFNSIKAFSKLFPFLSPKSVRTSLTKLKNDGWILTSNYNKQGTDKTSWYTLTDKAFALMGTTMCPNGHIELPKTANRIAQNGFSSYIQNNTTKDNTKESRVPALEECSPELAKAMTGFEEMRKRQKKPMTERAKELLLKKLEKMSGGSEEIKIAILDQSTVNGWSGIYQLKDNNGGGYQQKQTDGLQDMQELYEDAVRAYKEMGFDNDG